MENNASTGERTALVEREHISPSHEFARRILVGATKREALNPQVPLAPVTRESLGTLTERDYTLFNTRSNEERTAFWSNQPEQTHDAQMDTWLTNTQTLFANAQEFFTLDARGKEWATIYKRLGLSVENVNKDSLQQFYAKYLADPDLANGGIKLFVKDVLNAPEYKNAEGKLDTVKLQNDLPAITWIAHVFGENSSQVISRLTAAEGMVEENPEQLINNTELTMPPTEIKLLEFLRKEPLQPQRTNQESSTRSGKLPEGYQWKYGREKVEDEEIVADAELITELLNFPEIAKELKNLKPEKYGNQTIAGLTIKMAEEHNQLKQTLATHGVTPERLVEINTYVAGRYKEFLQKTYGITLPDMQQPISFPISGMLADYYSDGEAHARVASGYPIVFLDMDVVMKDSKKLTEKDWESLSKEESGQLIERELNEIYPHELTHLMEDMAYWSLLRTNPDGTEEIIEREKGKGGLLVAKPHETKIEDRKAMVTYRERGRGLMEAVTVELTNEWAKSMNSQLDLPAYLGERQVLNTLVDMLAKEQNISRHEAFKKFVDAYFSPKGFQVLAKELSGQQRDQEGRVSFVRPHFQPIVYALMEYEKEHAKFPDYNLTLAYVNNNPTPEQRTILANLALHGPAKDSKVLLPMALRKTIASQFNIDLPQTEEAPPPTATAAATENAPHPEATAHEIDSNRDLLSQVNEALKTETTNKIRFTATEATLRKYLKTLSVKGYKLDESDAVIKTTNGEHSFVVSGKVNVPFGSAAFTAILANNAAGGITVQTHTLDLQGSANFARGEIEKYITNLDEKIVEQINAKVDQAWEVANMKIGEDTLEMEFKKK